MKYIFICLLRFNKLSHPGCINQKIFPGFINFLRPHIVVTEYVIILSRISIKFCNWICFYHFSVHQLSDNKFYNKKCAHKHVRNAAIINCPNCARFFCSKAKKFICKGSTKSCCAIQHKENAPDNCYIPAIIVNLFFIGRTFYRLICQCRKTENNVRRHKKCDSKNKKQGYVYNYGIDF